MIRARLVVEGRVIMEMMWRMVKRRLLLIKVFLMAPRQVVEMSSWVKWVAVATLYGQGAKAWIRRTRRKVLGDSKLRYNII